MPTDTDLQQIRSVVTLYLEGMVWGQPEKLRLGFHPKAAAAGHDKGTYWNSPRDVFVGDWVAEENLPPGTPFNAAMTVMEVTGDLAVVKCTNTYIGDEFTDYLTLIKDDGQWQITHKAWFTHPKTA